MYSYKVIVLDDGDHNEEQLDYLKAVFKEALKNNHTFQSVEKHFEEVLDIEKHLYSESKVSRKLSSDKELTYVFLSGIGLHYSLIVTPHGDQNPKKRRIHLYAKCIPRKTLETLCAGKVADILTGVDKEESLEKTNLPQKIKNLVRTHI